MGDPSYPFDPASGQMPAYYPERGVSFAQRIAAMDEAGVAKAALVQFAAIHGATDNSYTLDHARLAPDRVAPVVCIDALAPDVKDRAARLISEGAVGLSIALYKPTAPPEHIRAAGAWEAAREHKVPLKVHLMRGEPSAIGLPWLKEMCARFPDVRVVLDHAGNPPWRDGIDAVLALASANATILFSTICLTRMGEAGVAPEAPLRALVDAFGARRIMWGSDSPNSAGAYPELVQRMRHVIRDLSSEDQDWIMGRTALAVYPQLARGL